MQCKHDTLSDTLSYIGICAIVVVVGVHLDRVLSKIERDIDTLRWEVTVDRHKVKANLKMKERINVVAEDETDTDQQGVR